MENIQTDRDLAIRIFKILYARSDGTPEGIMSEFHKVFVKSKQLSNSDFEEADHPRDNAGKFTDKDASVESSVKRTKQKTTAELLGVEYKGVKGKQAINLLRDKQQGYVKDAFAHKNLNISLIWGDENIGLCHIIKRRKETGQDLETLLDSLTQVIEQGTLEPDTNGKFLIKYGNKTAVIKLNLNKEEFTFLLTAFWNYK